MSNPAPRRALVVIDVQNEYFEGGGLPIEYPPVEQSLPNIAKAMDAARAAGTPVVVVRHHAPKGAPVFQADTHNGELHPEIAKRPRDHLITKAFPSVFTGTDFADWLARHEIDTLSVAGYMTQNCDASTVFEAMHRGLNVEFLSDATGALPYSNAAGHVSAEEIHRVFSVVFHSNFAAVTSTDAWIAALQAGQAIEKDNVLMSNRRARG
ncbi:nicotinamidase-related amidase [Variovorax paradoxus]|uniref:isochorismatase family protein n=1 Tax=Variovorax paradoxus TaxID=34073 RepID=UPI00278E64FD|nr:isochorismatase family protein [Variovorax paradoxus]MDQ0572715.1 nicotinamidase-related amidase [Variovorax paradoxus]